MLVFSLIGRWYLIPKLNKTSRRDILGLLLLINVFRYLPLSIFMPGQVADGFPPYLMEMVCYGDFLSGVLALIALLLLKSGRSNPGPMVWLFSVVSIADMGLVLTFAMSEKVYQLPLGANYFTVSVYVPLLIVVQAIILKIILSKAYQ